ncbi:hypothetical protein BVRB_2g037510 [Beta vulgaris subsp. vulgaris]|nr:hypothetical protein BVRB_2g037510 [Beta vulgaris subsp. vulgaris]
MESSSGQWWREPRAAVMVHSLDHPNSNPSKSLSPRKTPNPSLILSPRVPSQTPTCGNRKPRPSPAFLQGSPEFPFAVYASRTFLFLFAVVRAVLLASHRGVVVPLFLSPPLKNSLVTLWLFVVGVATVDAIARRRKVMVEELLLLLRCCCVVADATSLSCSVVVCCL